MSIVDHGDVILVVGRDDKVLKIKIDSHVFRTASKIFAALFGPNFAEGQNLAFDTPRDVPLLLNVVEPYASLVKAPLLEKLVKAICKS